MSKAPLYGWNFPAIRGIQARREFYVSMCPLRLIPRIFLFDEEELAPEMRAQRTLNKGRVPEMARYMIENRDNYTFSALTASIDADVHFEPIQDTGPGQDIGTLHIPMDARFIINDGQHRRAAIEAAMREQPELSDENIAVVFFLDVGLERCQQMFADLNRHAVRPSKSLGVLYDQRDDRAALARLVVLRSDLFSGIVEMERSTLAARSRKLFTLSAIYTGTTDLLDGLKFESRDEAANAAIEFWEEVSKNIREWRMVRDREISSGEVRQDFLHSHGITLHALGQVGNTLLHQHARKWKKKLARLSTIDWSRSNTALWEGRAMIGGRVSKAQANVILTRNVIKHHLGLSLTPEEQKHELKLGKAIA